MYNVASIGLIVIFILTVMFHVLVVFQVIPFTMVWGGKLESVEDMYRMEAVSLSLNLFFLAVMLIKKRIINTDVSVYAINIILRIMCALFALNTVGNIFSENRMEALIFTPITFVISVLLFIVIRHRDRAEASQQ